MFIRQCLFCFWFKTFPGHQGSAKTTFEKLSQRPIELKEFWSLSFRAMLLVEGSILEGYRCVTILEGANTRKVEMYGSAI